MSDTTISLPTNLVFVGGKIQPSNFTPPATCITDAAISSSAAITTAKQYNRLDKAHYQDPSGAVAAVTQDIYYCWATNGATVRNINCMINGTLATGDGTVTVDLKKSTGGASFSSILSGVVTLDSGNTLRITEAGTLSSSTLVTGDILQIVVAQGKSTGNQAKGLLVTVSIDEAGA